MLVRRRGIGTHVVDAPIVGPLELTSLFDDLASTQQRPRTALLAAEVIPDQVAKVLANHLYRASRYEYAMTLVDR